MINKLHQRPVPRFEPFPREMMDKCLFPCGCTQDETGFRFFFFFFFTISCNIADKIIMETRSNRIFLEIPQCYNSNYKKNR